MLALPAFGEKTEKTGKTGERVYRSKCKSCHGAKGEGINPVLAKKRKLDPETLLLKPMEEKTDEEVRKLIVDGKDKMPGFGEKLSAEQIDAVVDYCRILVPRKEGD
jgi:mono/diheme cytochrome c family protein